MVDRSMVDAWELMGFSKVTESRYGKSKRAVLLGIHSNMEAKLAEQQRRVEKVKARAKRNKKKMGWKWKWRKY